MVGMNNHELLDRYERKIGLLGVRNADRLVFNILDGDRVELVRVPNYDDMEYDELVIPKFVTDIRDRVFQCTRYKKIIIEGYIKDLSRKFSGVNSVELEIELKHGECVKSIDEILSDCKNLKVLVLRGFNLSICESSVGAFSYNKNMEYIDIRDLRMPMCKDMSGMFRATNS